MSTSSNTPPEDYFNDLSQPTGNDARRRHKSPPLDFTGADVADGGDAAALKPKRIACIICRKRKLKCDGSKPACSTCKRLGHDCAYDEVRRKSGPKRGYVKALEERLKQVETLLKTQDVVVAPAEVIPPAFTAPSLSTTGVGLDTINAGDLNLSAPSLELGGNVENWGYNGESPQQPLNLDFTTDMSMNMGIDDSTFTWEMIGLGLEEPLPPQDTIDELHQIYFDKIHPSLPMIHKFRYLAAMNLAPNQRPPVALRYAMWTLSASITEKYMTLRDHFYHRARKYMELDSLKGHGEHIISIAHAQTHILLTSFEFKMMYFPRAWQSTGAAVRLVQMMGLYRLDGAGLDVKQCLPPPRDWTEREERRRTFWMAFCEDRYASIGTGWPMTIDEKDILTDLPASDEAFEMSKPEPTQTLQNSMSPVGASKLSACGAICLMACLFGRNLLHMHRPGAEDRDHDLNGEFWKRHRSLDNILLNTSLSMPSHLKLPTGISNANIVFVNMNIHTSTICLHQAAIYKSDKNKLPASISAESKVRCVTAAGEIAAIMRLISHMDLAAMNPFMSFCLYVAARVFVQYLKSKPEDDQIGDSLMFLLSAMNAMKIKNPLTESFMVQLDVDIDGLGMRGRKYKGIFPYGEQNPGANLPNQGYADGWEPATGANECNFMRVVEELAPTSPPINDTNEFRRDSEPASLNAETRNTSFSGNSATGWGPIDHSQNKEFGQNVHQNFQGLDISGTKSTYGVRVGTGIGYDHSDSSHTGDTGQSPGTTNSASSRPTPNSTPSEARPSHASQSKSYNNSYRASPSSQPQNLGGDGLVPFFSPQPDFNNLSTGLTPGNDFAMSETPGRGFDMPPGWEMANSTQTGLTPVGQGVFNTLMGLGPMDPMDIGWDAGSPPT